MKKKASIFILSLAISILLALSAGCATPAAKTDVTDIAAATDTPVSTDEPAAATDTPVASAAATAYEAIIAQYIDAVQNNFYADLDPDAQQTAIGENVAFELMANPQPIQYAIADINGDGVEELVISSVAGEYKGVNYDIYSFDGTNAVKLFDMDFGYRTNFNVFADGTIKVAWSNSAMESGCDYYKLNGTAAELVTTLSIMGDVNNTEVIHYMQDSTEISEEEYNTKTAELEASGEMQFTYTAIA